VVPEPALPSEVPTCPLAAPVPDWPGCDGLPEVCPEAWPLTFAPTDAPACPAEPETLPEAWPPTFAPAEGWLLPEVELEGEVLDGDEALPDVLAPAEPLALPAGVSTLPEA
jgi:hypothetical protein